MDTSELTAIVREGVDRTFAIGKEHGFELAKLRARGALIDACATVTTEQSILLLSLSKQIDELKL